jgi:acyl-CoA dehydrogenase
LMLRDFGTDSQKRDFIPPMLEGKMAWSFGLTEAAHGSDATHMETRAVPEMRDGVAGYRIDGEKMWITGVHKTSHVMTFARTNGEDGKARGITCFVVPVDTPGFDIGQYMWTFNMPTDHAKIAYNGVWVSESAILGELDNGLAVAQHFVHENRIRQAASSLGAAQYCIDEAVKYARERKPFGKALATNQGIQFPLVELQTDAEMLRLLIYKTAAEMDTMTKPEVAIRLSDKVSMCNYKANRLCCNAADFAMQVHGGMGYSRHKPFEHIYRHHRRYRITEGAEEIQMRKVAEHLFGFMG